MDFHNCTTQAAQGEKCTAMPNRWETKAMNYAPWEPILWPFLKAKISRELLPIAAENWGLDNGSTEMCKY